MSEELQSTAIHEVYHPLYLNNDKFIVLVTGGRGSGKSFECSRYIERLTFEKGHTIVFTRWTMTSAEKSVIPEVTDKIERDGTGDFFDVTTDKVVNKLTGSNILFMGIRTSSGKETAKLKSIKGMSVFVCDEAEEWTSEKDFEKMILSIRQKNVRNLVLIIMNPSTTNHFIYQRYIKDTHRIEEIDGAKVQISTHPRVLHIHTTYKNNLDYLSNDFIREVQEMREKDKEKYDHLVMGQWIDQQEGAVFKDFELIDDLPLYIQWQGIGLDFGFTNDPSAGIRCAVYEDTLYLDEIFYSTGMLGTDLINALKPYNLSVTSESADPRLVREIQLGGVRINAVTKGAGSVIAGLNKMQEYKIKITKRSVNLIYEFQNYLWDTDRDGAYTNQPIDKNNHGIDAVRYFILERVLGWGKGRKKRKLTL